MSVECSECERDLRGGHDPECSRYLPEHDEESSHLADRARRFSAAIDRLADIDPVGALLEQEIQVENLTGEAAGVRVLQEPQFGDRLRAELARNPVMPLRLFPQEVEALAVQINHDVSVALEAAWVAGYDGANEVMLDKIEALVEEMRTPTARLIGEKDMDTVDAEPFLTRLRELFR